MFIVYLRIALETSEDEKMINMLWVISLVAQVTLWQGMFNCLLRSASLPKLLRYQLRWKPRNTKR